MIPWYCSAIFASCGITTYSICLRYLLTNFDCKKIQNYILFLESVLSLLIFIGYLVLGLANHFWLADSFICGSLTFLLYVKADISLILNAISSYVKFKTTKRVIKLEVWWSDSKCAKLTTRIVLSTMLIEFILDLSCILMDWEYLPEYTLCMKKEHPGNEHDPHDTVSWLVWDAIVIFFIILIIFVIKWDISSYQLVKRWVDAQDRYLLHNLSAEELHLKNEPQLKSTIINALVLCFYGIYSAIQASLIDVLTFDDVSLIYQTSTIIFLPLILFWNHEVAQQTNGEHERENRRRLVYDEARDRRAEIAAKRVQRTQQQTFEMERIEKYRVQALKGEFGMYGGDGSELQDQDDRASIDYYGNEFQNVQLNNLDHYLWI